MTADCVICLQPATDEQTLGCQHRFCRACIKPWLEVNNRCPICSHLVGDKPINQLVHSPEEEQAPPCIDHLYPELHNIGAKLQHLSTRIQTKLSASMKACISQNTLNSIADRQQEVEELFDLFSLLVNQGGSIGEAVALMESINFGILDMESMLEGRSVGFAYSPEESSYYD